jgi:hypothetical protein
MKIVRPAIMYQWIYQLVVFTYWLVGLALWEEVTFSEMKD